MPNYLFTYRLTQQAADAPIRAVADKEFSLTTDDEAMAAWGAFFEENGSVFIDPGMPVFERTSVGEVGPSTVLGGFRSWRPWTSTAPLPWPPSARLFTKEAVSRSDCSPTSGQTTRQRNCEMELPKSEPAIGSHSCDSWLMASPKP